LKAYKNIIYELSKSLPAILSFGGEAHCKISQVLYLLIGWQQGQNTLSEWSTNLCSHMTSTRCWLHWFTDFGAWKQWHV